jgi:hypothetical protein
MLQKEQLTVALSTVDHITRVLHKTSILCTIQIKSDVKEQLISSQLIQLKAVPLFVLPMQLVSAILHMQQ